MKLRPLHDRVIVKRLENETKTASGIVIPDNVAEKPDQGEVLAVGPGKRDDKGVFITLNIKVGDRVLFGKYSGPTVKCEGDAVLVSILGELGMRNGDMLQTINGFDMSDPDKAVDAYAQLRRAGKLNLAFSRDGAPQTVNVKIK